MQQQHHYQLIHILYYQWILYYIVIGLEEACPTIWGPGQTIWSATSQAACRRCDGADKTCLGVWQSTQGLCQGSFHHSSSSFGHIINLIQVCRWSLCCAGSARLYGLPVLHHIQASWNRRKINITKSKFHWLASKFTFHHQFPKQLWQREEKLGGWGRDCDGGTSQVPSRTKYQVPVSSTK